MRLLDSGELGEPGLLRIHRWESLETGNWPALDQEQGSVIVRNLSAEVDLAIWLFGGLPYGGLRNRAEGVAHGGIAQPDYLQVHLGFEGDGMSVIDYSASLPPGPRYHFLSMIGSKGAAYADDHHNVNLVYGERRHTGARCRAQARRSHPGPATGVRRRGVAKAGTQPTTGVDGRTAVLVAEAAADSMCSGRTARLAGGQYGLD